MSFGAVVPKPNNSQGLNLPSEWHKRRSVGEKRESKCKSRRSNQLQSGPQLPGCRVDMYGEFVAPWIIRPYSKHRSRSKDNFSFFF